MSSISLDDVAHILNVHKSRIEQWISRDQFLPQTALGRGRKREWNKVEVLRLAVFAHLVDEVGMAPTEAGRLTQSGIHLLKNSEAYFVCYKTEPPIGLAIWDRDVVGKREISNFLMHGCHVTKILQAGCDEETIRRNSEPSLGSADIAVIVDLERIVGIIENAWPK